MAGLVGDFNKDGLDDVVVANNGDGKVHLFLGGQDGLSLADSQRVDGLLHPSALVFGALGIDGLQLYLTDEGEESIARLTFDLDFSGAPPELNNPALPVQPPGLPAKPPTEDSLDSLDSVATGSAAGFSLA